MAIDPVCKMNVEPEKAATKPAVADPGNVERKK